MAIDPNAPNAPRMLTAAKRAQLAHDLRMRHWSLRQIAAHQVLDDGTTASNRDIEQGLAKPLYKGPSGVAAAIARVRKQIQKETREDAHAVRAMDLERIDRYLAALHPLMIGAIGVAPDPHAHQVAQRWFDRKAKILGYDFRDGLDERSVRVQELQVAEWDKALGKAAEQIGLPEDTVAALRTTLVELLVGDDDLAEDGSG